MNRRAIWGIGLGAVLVCAGVLAVPPASAGGGVIIGGGGCSFNYETIHVYTNIAAYGSSSVQVNGTSYDNFNTFQLSTASGYAQVEGTWNIYGTPESIGGVNISFTSAPGLFYAQCAPNGYLIASQNAYDANWAGYIDTGQFGAGSVANGQNFVYFSTEFTIPTATGGSGSTGDWIGLGGDLSGYLWQTGLDLYYPMPDTTLEGWTGHTTSVPSYTAMGVEPFAETVTPGGGGSEHGLSIGYFPASTFAGTVFEFQIWAWEDNDSGRACVTVSHSYEWCQSVSGLDWSAIITTVEWIIEEPFSPSFDFYGADFYQFGPMNSNSYFSPNVLIDNTENSPSGQAPYTFTISPIGLDEGSIGLQAPYSYGGAYDDAVE